MKKYQIIYADPPWKYQNRKNCDPALGGFKYPPMDLQDICNLPIQKISAENCALAMWVTMPMLREGLQVIESWGFKYITCLFNWIKLNPKNREIYSGLGHWVNGNAELCLFGKKGKPKRCAKNVKQIQMYPKVRHSSKPAKFRDELVRLFGDVPRIELFARKENLLFDAGGFEGWDVWGNEVESDINLKGIKNDNS